MMVDIGLEEIFHIKLNRTPINRMGLFFLVCSIAISIRPMPIFRWIINETHSPSKTVNPQMQNIWVINPYTQ